MSVRDHPSGQQGDKLRCRRTAQGDAGELSRWHRAQVDGSLKPLTCELAGEQAAVSGRIICCETDS